MKISRVITVAALVSVTGYAFAQSTKSETTVESEYLSNIEDTIITEMATSPDYDNKLVALGFLEEAINNGRSSPEMVAALSGLAGDGILTQARTNNRVTNNFPDVRRKACELLGQIPTEESKNTLVQITLNDNEPMVLSAAVHALGEIGINNNDEVSAAIAWAEKRSAILNPTSSFGFECIVAYEKLVDTVQDKKPLVESATAIAKNNKYNRQVRTKALQFLKAQAQGSSSSNEK